MGGGTHRHTDRQAHQYHDSAWPQGGGLSENNTTGHLESEVDIFTESGPRQIQSSSCEVRLWICPSVPLQLCPAGLSFSIVLVFLLHILNHGGHHILIIDSKISAV